MSLSLHFTAKRSAYKLRLTEALCEKTNNLIEPHIMFKRKCPECDETKVSIPIVGHSYRCNSCHTRFKLRNRIRWFVDYILEIVIFNVVLFGVIFSSSWYSVFLIFVILLAVHLLLAAKAPLELSGSGARFRKYPDR